MAAISLHHAGLYVADLARSIAFYRDTFGLEPAERLTFGDEEIVFLGVGAARLELIASAVVPARPAGVVDHVAFDVDDLDATLASLRARGVPVLDAEPIPVPALGVRIAFLLGPDGERIELVARG